MASVNKVILIGNLGRDPEVRYAPSGSAICNVTIATSRNWKDKTSGERQEETEWHRVVFYDRLAEIAGEYLKKGKSVYVEGRLKTRKWTDKDGVEKYTTEIIAQEMTMLGAREEIAMLVPFVLDLRQPSRGASVGEIGDRVITLDRQGNRFRGERRHRGRKQRGSDRQNNMNGISPRDIVHGESPCDCPSRASNTFGANEAVCIIPSGA